MNDNEDTLHNFIAEFRNEFGKSELKVLRFLEVVII